jgi:hypothetical protein
MRYATRSGGSCKTGGASVPRPGRRLSIRSVVAPRMHENQMCAGRQQLPNTDCATHRRAMNPRNAEEIRKLWCAERRALLAQMTIELTRTSQSAGSDRSFGKGPNLDKPARCVPLFDAVRLFRQWILPIRSHIEHPRRYSLQRLRTRQSRCGRRSVITATQGCVRFVQLIGRIVRR